MRIKRLSLQGYKTFATKTEFLFDDGITAIVGPNGSGKSNIADALRWVLGEQSYSSLRGKRTADMIFAGSQSRARAGMAQALLTLDNSEGWLPIDYTEVEIGRRAYRSGENEYILNGQKVRLKDVTELLATSGLAQRTYTIIGQGLVDQALSLRSEERRALFEEAAGINHYKTRRAETMRRLQETQRNLQRIHDILAEIQPRLTSLKRQATRARNYEQVAVDLQNLLTIWYGYKWEQAKKELRRARDTAVSAEKSWQQSRHTLRVHQEEADEQRRHIRRLEQQAADLQSQRDTTRDQLETARREVAILRERQQIQQKQLAEIETEIPLLEQQVETAQSALATAVADLEAAQANLDQNRQQLQQFNTGFEAQQTEINRWQQAKQKAELTRRQHQTRAAQAQGQLNQLHERLRERTAEAGDGDPETVTQLNQQIESLTAVLQTNQQQADSLRQEQEQMQAQRQTLIQDLKQLRRQQRESEQTLNHRRRELARLEARLEMLDQLRLKEAQVADGVQLIGTLAAFITIPDEYQTAVESALAARLATLLLPDEANLWRLLTNQPENTAVSALALDHIQPPEAYPPPDDTAVIGWAADVIGCRPEAQTAVQLLLGHILLVQDVDAAYRLAQSLPPGATAVAPDGFLAHSGGLVQTGLTGQSSILARETEWRQAQTQLDQKNEEVAALETAVAQAQNDIQTRQAEVDRLQTEEQALARRLVDEAQNIAQAQRNLDQQQQQQIYLDRQRRAQHQEIEHLQQRIGEIEAQIEADEAEIGALDAQLQAADVQLQALPVTEAEQQREGLRQGITAAQTIVAGRQAVVDSRRATLNQIQGQLDRLQTRRAELIQEQEQASLSAREQAWQKSQADLDDLDGRLQPMRAHLAQSRAELAQLEEATAVAQKETHDAETRYTQVKIAFNQHTNAIENLQERIQTDLGIVALHYDDDQTGPTPLPIADIKELPEVAELPEDIEDTIHQYRAQMQRMGAINPDAPEEYEETLARFDFLTQQVEDLNQTEAKLRQVIAELDDLTSKAFAETVEKVNNVFGHTFTQLFGGGSGRLVLTDPDDLTISGVDIIARLPHRREQALGLLSGGERSLTAVALIFSLLKVSPTPFCVLDEVDAALDEANINRFRELLRELSISTQFIVITHNRGTVQAAQTIYGISMGTDSASQAISIKPEDYVKQPELI